MRYAVIFHDSLYYDVTCFYYGSWVLLNWTSARNAPTRLKSDVLFSFWNGFRRAGATSAMGLAKFGRWFKCKRNKALTTSQVSECVRILKFFCGTSWERAWKGNRETLIIGKPSTDQIKIDPWLVVDLPLWKIWFWSVGMMTFPIYGKIKCSKPPTRPLFWFLLWNCQSPLCEGVFWSTSEWAALVPLHFRLLLGTWRMEHLTKINVQQKTLRTAKQIPPGNLNTLLAL